MARASESAQFRFTTRIQVMDGQGALLLDTTNAIHKFNMLEGIARALTGETNFELVQLRLGNGGLNTDGTAKPTKTSYGEDGSLYSEVWSSANAAAGLTSSFAIDSTTHFPTLTFTTVVDASTSFSSSAATNVCNEMGLFFDLSSSKAMATHLIFDNISKQPDANGEKKLVITYTITITA